MSGLVLAAALDQAPPPRDIARAMAAAAPYRSRAGARELTLGPAVAIALDGAQEPRLLNSTPCRSADGSLLLVADARIDNRQELAAALGLNPPAPPFDDGALLMAAYQRWGESFAGRLLGEFALALWDHQRRHLIAARDGSGLRPLVYHHDLGRRILIASDVRQIRAAAGVGAALNDRYLAAFLAAIAGPANATAYRDIVRLPPGDTLRVTALSAHVLPHAAAAPRPHAAALSAEAHAERLRASLAEAVRSRLDVTRRSALLLSGGVDSTAIAATAAALRRSDSLESELLTYSFAFAELTACDERDVSDQVVQALGLPNEAIPADDAWPLARGTADGTQIDGPCRFRSHVLVARCLPLVHRAGATALIMGQRGDALVGGDAVDWVDRIRRGELAYVWSRMSLHARHSRQSRLALAHRHVIRPLAASVWPTRVAASLRRRLWSRVDGSRPVVPVWMDRRAVRSFGLHELADELTPQSELRDEAGRARDRRMRDPHHERNAEAIELQYALHGIRYVDPWADRRLIATLLACPADLAYRAGEPKWLLRQALAGLIPEAARVGLRKRTLQPLYERGLVDRSRPEVLRLIDGSRAAARGYVDARVLHTAYDGFVDRPRRVTGREWSFLWRFIELESWLRRLDVR